MRPVRRWSAVRRAILAALVLAVLAAGGYVGLAARPWEVAAGKLAVPPRSAPAMAAIGTAAPDPTGSGLQRVLSGALADPALGPSVAAVVTDPMTGAVLYDRAGSREVPPASTAKLATATAALLTLGPDARIPTRTVLAGPTLYLVGGGDPTLASAGAHPPYPGAARLDDLAALTAKALQGKAISSVHLAVDTSAYAGPRTAPGWKTTYVTAGDVAPVSALEVDEGRVDPARPARYADPARAAGVQFAAALHRHGVRVAGPVGATTAPPTAAALAAVESPPVAALVQRMLTFSDNDLAEALARQVARAAGRPMSFVDGARAVADAVAPVVGDAVPRLADGSGLSVLDRVSPRTLARLLAAAASPDRPELRAVVDGLPVAGFTGTLDDRYARGPAASARGLVRAKTGTLAGVSSLAGLVVDADGRLLAFAVVADRAPYYATAEAALDRAAARLAGCGCR